MPRNLKLNKDKQLSLNSELGYYEEDNFGIKLDNVELVVETDTKYNKSNKQFLTFETLTTVPIQARHILPNLLTDEEVRLFCYF